jgi:putrescine aminotransferase
MDQTVTFTTKQWQEMDAAHFLHPFTDHKALHQQGSRIITRAKGVYLWDSEDRKILDGMAGLWCAAVGHGHPELVAAATRQMSELSFYNAFFKTATPPAITLAHRLAELTGQRFRHAFFACSGSEAVDSIIRTIRHYWMLKGEPARQIIIGRQYGYHGSTIAGSAAGGMTDMHKQAGQAPGFSHIMAPYWYGSSKDETPEEFGLRAARALEERILELGPENVAAFLAEPLQGAGGVIIPPSTYWPEIQRICRTYDILLAADEVISGFGRTGRWFGSDTFHIEADLMSVAKGLTSGYVPLSAMLVGDRVADTLISEGGEYNHGFTYSGHPVACAVALANLDVIERDGLVGKSASQGEKLRAALHARLDDHPLVGEIRGVGLVGAIELTADKKTRAFFPEDAGVGLRCRNHCFRNDFIMRAVRDTMVFAPPLIINDEQIDEFAARAAHAIDLTLAEVKDAGLC